MKRFILVQIAKYIDTFHKINSILRVDDTIIKIELDKKQTLFFDMKKGDSYIFKKDSYSQQKIYTAPFDIALQKYFNNSKIEKVEILTNNRILQITVNSSSSYKSKRSILQLEFTGKNTNAIILDENSIIIEAMRHISKNTSFREVQVGVKLIELPPREFNETKIEIPNLETFLYEEHKKREIKRLSVLKNQTISSIKKQIAKLQDIQNKIENEDSLNRKIKEYEINGHLILANLHNITNYQTSIEVTDFEGNKRVLELPKIAKSPSHAAEIFFKQSKKLKQKIKFSYIEKQNLSSKIEFLQNLITLINSAKSIDELNLYTPKKQKKQKKKILTDNTIESFFIDGYKISLGKNEKGNINLLKSAKMRDIWLHLKDIPSTHVIIRSDKKSVPLSVLEFAAKLCVQFSKVSKGSYLVDYTHRRNVKIKEGANVNYIEYKTLKVTKE